MSQKRTGPSLFTVVSGTDMRVVGSLQGRKRRFPFGNINLVQMYDEMRL